LLSEKKPKLLFIFEAIEEGVGLCVC
jgi:hypothetical protein